MSRAKIIRIQLEYNPNSSSTPFDAIGAIDLSGLGVALLAALGFTIGTTVGVGVSVAAIRRPPEISAKLKNEKNLALGFLIEKKRKKFYQELEKARPSLIYVQSGKDLKTIIEMVKLGEAQVTDIVVTEKPKK